MHSVMHDDPTFELELIKSLYFQKGRLFDVSWKEKHRCYFNINSDSVLFICPSKSWQSAKHTHYQGPETEADE